MSPQQVVGWLVVALLIVLLFFAVMQVTAGV